MMKKMFQYTRRASQRRLHAFETSRALQANNGQAAPAPDSSEAEPNTLIEGKTLRGQLADKEYTSN